MQVSWFFSRRADRNFQVSLFFMIFPFLVGFHYPACITRHDEFLCLDESYSPAFAVSASTNALKRVMRDVAWARQDRGVCFLGDKAGSLKKSLDSLKCPGLKA